MCDLEKPSRMRRPWLALGRSATEKNVRVVINSQPTKVVELSRSWQTIYFLCFKELNFSDHVQKGQSLASVLSYPPPPPRATIPSGSGPPCYPGFTSSLRHTAICRPLVEEWYSPTQKPVPDNTQHLYAPGGIRTHNPTKRAASESRFRLRGRFLSKYIVKL
jgi:hypothetical protein